MDYKKLFKQGYEFIIDYCVGTQQLYTWEEIEKTLYIIETGDKSYMPMEIKIDDDDHAVYFFVLG